MVVKVDTINDTQPTSVLEPENGKMLSEPTAPAPVSVLKINEINCNRVFQVAHHLCASSCAHRKARHRSASFLTNISNGSFQ